DRCKPDQVLEILEAINFLAESGDCVIVLGIDRERVIGCVAIGFKEVASVLAQAMDAAVVDKPIVAAADASKKTDIHYQVAFARHYLAKLLNREVPIPPATPDGLGNVMTNDKPAAKKTPGEESEADPDVQALARRRARRQLYSAIAAAFTVGA